MWQVWQKRLPLTVVTEYLVYDDMVLESFEVPKSRDQGGGLWFSASLVKIVTVRTLTATLPPEVVARLKRKRAKTKPKQKEDAERKARVDRESAIAQETATGKVSTPPASSAVASKAGGLV